MIVPLPNPDFLARLLKCVRGARRSIILVNYLAEIPEVGPDPVTEIAHALIRAKGRGVRIQVLLEGLKLGNNYPFYRLLKDAGVDVWMDTSRTFIHHKVLLVDDSLIIVGSHNLTKAALTDHEEFSIITDDAATIERFKSELTDITSQREGVRALAAEKDVVILPRGFLGAVAAPLFKPHAMKAFDLYMKFCLEDAGRRRPLKIQDEAWGSFLGFDPSTAGRGVSERYLKDYYKQRIGRILHQLRRRGLIEIDRGRDTVTRLCIKSPFILPLTRGCCRNPSPLRGEGEDGGGGEFRGDCLQVPVAYWRYGWPARLSFPAKYFYLISLAEATGSPFYPWWSRSIASISKTYGCTQDISIGARELEDFGILEILRAVAVKRGGTYSEEAQFYRLNPFYDMADFEKGVASLEKRYPRAHVIAARRVASIFWRSHDLPLFEDICGQIKLVGLKKVMRAAGRVKALPRFSALRSPATLMRWL